MKNFLTPIVAGLSVCLCLATASAAKTHKQATPNQATPEQTAAAPSRPADIMSVSGTRLLRNGKPFIVHGVQIDPFDAPKEWYGPGLFDNAFLRAAYDHFGPEELQHAKDFGANTIDFQVGQLGLDPENTGSSTKDRVAYSPGYVTELTNGVHLARSMGFVVVLSIADSRYGGDGHAQGLPRGSTERAAKLLADLFKDDGGVVLELLSEPYGTATDNWPTYINGGDDYVGINQIIRTVRGTGAQNLLIVQALGQNFTGYERYLNKGGAPITDPLHGALAYGVHPYFNFPKIGTEIAGWDAAYGDFAATHPVIVTEWSQNSKKPAGRPNNWCFGPLGVRLADRAFQYFNEKGINGVIGWAFDDPMTIVSDFNGTPRTLEGFSCGQPGGGIGVLLKAYFNGSAGAPSK